MCILVTVWSSSFKSACNPSFTNVLLLRGPRSLLQANAFESRYSSWDKQSSLQAPFSSLCTATRPGLTTNKGALTQAPPLSRFLFLGLPVADSLMICTIYCISHFLIGPRISRPTWFIAPPAKSNKICILAWGVWGIICGRRDCPTLHGPESWREIEGRCQLWQKTVRLLSMRVLLCN